MQTTHQSDPPTHARHELARQVIEMAFNDLKTWCRPHTEYTKQQRENLFHEFFRTEVYELAVFFVRRATDEPSGIEHLAGAMEIDVGRIMNICRPLVAEAVRQANLFRESRGLEPYWQLSI